MKKHLILALILFFGTAVSQAQWQPDLRLTNDPANSFTAYYGNASNISASGNVVHVVWEENRDGNYEIYYKRSTDGGTNWGAETRLTNNSFNSFGCAVSVLDSTVHVVWFDDRDGNNEIYYKRSADGGISWGADTRLTNAAGSSGSPSISVSGTIVHVVWDDARTSPYEIFYKRSTDGGITWGADLLLSTAPGSSHIPSLAVSGLEVHVTWEDNRDGNNEIYYKRSTDAGISWGTDTRLTNDPAASNQPSVSVSGSTVHIAWDDNRDGNTEIYYKRSTDAGISWGTDTRLTNDPAASSRPSITVSGLAAHIVCSDNRDGNFEIYYKSSTDGGISWGVDIRLTNDPAWSQFPSVSVSGQVVHVVWEDDRDGNWEIYYKRDPIGNPVGIDESFLNENALQFSPNPLTNTTTISFSLTQSEKASLKIFDVNGRLVTTLANKIFEAGENEITWNAAEINAGIYFLRMETANYSENRKLIVAK